MSVLILVLNVRLSVLLRYGEELKAISIRRESEIFADTVKDHNGVVDGVSNHCQNGCDKGHVYFHGERHDTPQSNAWVAMMAETS